MKIKRFVFFLLVLVLGMSSLFWNMRVVKGTTTYFSEDWTAGNYDQWTSFLNWGDSGRSIIDEGGSRGNVLNLTGLDWTSGSALASNDVVNDTPASTHIGFLFKLVTNLGSGSGFRMIGGLSELDWIEPYAGMGINDTNYQACWEGDLANYTGINPSLTVGTWNQIDIFSDNVLNMTYYYVNDTLRYSRAYARTVDLVDTPVVEFNPNGFVSAGTWEVRFDDILVDDASSPTTTPPPPSPIGIQPDYNFGIGLVGLIFMFLSWFVAYWEYKADNYGEAFLYWLVLFVIGFGLFTVLLGG